MRGIVLFTVAAVNKSGGECIMHSMHSVLCTVVAAVDKIHLTEALTASPVSHTVTTF